MNKQAQSTEIFTTKQLMKATGLTYPQLTWLTRGKNKFLTPFEGGGQGKKAFYTFAQVMAVRHWLTMRDEADHAFKVVKKSHRLGQW